MPSQQSSEPLGDGAIPALEALPRRRITGPGGRSGRSPDEEHLLDRLHQLRKLVPAFAADLASARRQTAKLRAENRRLQDQVRRLQREHDRLPGSGHVREPRGA